MKLAVAVAGENALPSAFVVWRGFEASIRKAAESGYNGVELALKNADEIDPLQLSKWLDKYKLEVSCISTGQVFAASGLCFTHPDPEVRRNVIEVFKGLIGLAKDFGQIINVGRVRGYIDEKKPRKVSEDLFIDTARRVCEIAAPAGVKIIIEPVNRYEINFVNNVDEGAELLAKVGCENMGLMPDVFHMNIEDDRIGDSLVRNGKLVSYIHFADSNRLAPGRGHLDFDEVFHALGTAKFNGWASVEILPKPDPDTAAREAAEFLLPRVSEFNKTCL